HGAGGVHGALGDLPHARQVVAAVGGGAGGLVGEEQPGHPAPGRLLTPRGREDVVGAQHGRRGDALGGDDVGGQVEVVDVAAVVAVQVEHARPAVGGAGGRRDLLGGGGGEHVADRDAGGQALTDVAEEEGQVAGAAAGHDPHPAGHGRVRTDQRPPVRRGRAQPVGVGQQQRLGHLVDEVLRVVDDLLQCHVAHSLSRWGGVAGGRS